MIYQTDPKLGRYMNKYGCLFTSIAFARPYLNGKDWSASELREAWDTSILKGWISGDLNLDGDMDDKGELEIQNYPEVCKVLGNKVSWIPGHHHPETKLDDSMFIIGAFFNPRTSFTHFAVIDTHLKVVFDPIYGGSVTCREGHIKSLRLFSIL